MLRTTWVFLKRVIRFIYRTFTFCGSLSQYDSITDNFCNSLYILQNILKNPTTPNAQRLQAWHAFGLGCTPFAHHYLGHLLRFLFLRLLRCFTSPGCRPRKGRMDCSMQVSPFRHPRIKGCLLLPAAFRSWLRLSSASGAKAFPACPLYLNLINPLLTSLNAIIHFT